MSKKIKSLACLLCAVSVGSVFAGCDFGESSSSSEETVAASAATSFVSLEINPSIELTVDANDKVVSVYAGNEDAQVLLHGESLEELDVEKAVEKITDLAVELGYLSEDNKVVGVSVSGESASALEEKINAKITATAKNLGLSVSLDLEGAYSLLRKYEEFKREHPDKADISVDKFKLAISAAENGEISLEAAVELDDSKLIEKIAEAHKRVEKFATDEFHHAKVTATGLYDSAVMLAVDSVYTTYYAERTANAIMAGDLLKAANGWYGAAYQTYKSTARGFTVIADAYTFVEKAVDYELTEEQVDALVTAFALTDETPLENPEGEVTIKSVEKFADKAFKNSDEYAAVKETVTQTLDEAYTAARAEFNAKYKQAIEDAITKAKSLKEQYSALLPDSFKTDIDTIISEIEGIIATGELNVAKLREYARTFEEKAQDMLEKIKADLSEEEYADLQARIKAAMNSLEENRKDMQDALDKAEKDAKDRLNAKKEERRQKHGQK